MLGGTLAFSGPGTTAIDQGSYAVAPVGLTSTNYHIVFDPGTLNINALPVSLTGSRNYDGTTNAASPILTVSNAIAGDTVSVASGSGALAGKDVGTWSLTSLGSLALGNNAKGDYTLTGATGSVTIIAAPLDITANDASKIFSTLKTFSNTAFTQTGLVAGDTILGVMETSLGAPATAAVGTYAIVPSAATGTGLSNYNVNYVNGTLTVFPPLSVPTTIQTAYENVNQTISGISIASGLSGSLTLALRVSHGKLTLGTTGGLTVTGNGTGSVTAVGPTANLNAALAGLNYRGSLNYFGNETLSVTLSNNGISFNASVAINVVSIAQQDNALQAQVKALQTAKILAVQQASILLADLILHGNSGDIGKIGSFINDVHGYVNSDVLTQTQANALLGPANILLLGLKVEFGS